MTTFAPGVLCLNDGEDAQWRVLTISVRHGATARRAFSVLGLWQDEGGGEPLLQTRLFTDLTATAWRRA